MVQITPAAAGPNPFAGPFLFPVPALIHFKVSKQVFHAFVINDQLDPKIWPSKAQTSVKDFSSEHIPVTHIQLKSLGNNFQSHCNWNCIHLHATAFRMILWQFHPQLWEIFCQHEVLLMHAHQSWQAASISRFRTAAAFSSSRRCAWWQTVHDTFFQPCGNAISRIFLGKFLAMVLVWWLLS